MEESFVEMFPKEIYIDCFTAENMLSFVYEMNDILRKSLYYSAQEELFDEFLDRCI